MFYFQKNQSFHQTLGYLLKSEPGGTSPTILNHFLQEPRCNNKVKVNYISLSDSLAAALSLNMERAIHS